MVTEPKASVVRIWSIEFQELYARHLCRHSQFGNNVVHVLCLMGVYFGLYGLAYRLLPSPWVCVAVAVPYLLLLAVNVPIHVWCATVLFLAGFIAGVLNLPQLPVWCYPIFVAVFYKLQSWSHKAFTKASDMTEFDKKYPKGFAMFCLLSIYELPVLLCYLFFGRKDWCA
jgi:hypothetical protein